MENIKYPCIIIFHNKNVRIIARNNFLAPYLSPLVFQFGLKESRRRENRVTSLCQTKLSSDNAPARSHLVPVYVSGLQVAHLVILHCKSYSTMKITMVIPAHDLTCNVTSILNKMVSTKQKIQIFVCHQMSALVTSLWRRL